MLSRFGFYLDDAATSVAELEKVTLSLLKFGFISDYVFDSIYSALALIYPKEIKRTAKELCPDESEPRFAVHFFPSDVLVRVKKQEQFVHDFRNAIAYVVNLDQFLVDPAHFLVAAKAIKAQRSAA